MKSKVLPSKIQELAYESRVKEAMTDDIVTVNPDTTIRAVREILKDKRISGIPVIEDAKIVGIISIENFIKCIINGGIDKKVKESMTSELEVLYSNEPLIYALNKFAKFKYGRFPVIERNTKKLVGILSKGDIIKCLLRKLERDYLEEETYNFRASHIFDDIESDNTAVILKYIIKGGEYKRAGEKSGFLKKNLLKLGISPKIARRIIVASCEAEMNIIIFTEGGEILARVEEDKIKVNAVDRGPGIPDIKKVMKPGFSTAPDWVREMGFGAGMGLPNIKNCTDEMKIESKPGEGTNLEFMVRLN
jgi:CBS domain-containing protein/anti-sigma regulatory factor (Ser/Thr protein kinase)